MLSKPKGLYRTLTDMHNLGVLESIIPEIKNIKGRVHHDIYHSYTVDIHSLMAIRELEKLESGNLKNEYPFLSSLAKSINKADRLILHLAGLLHDIGKGRGKDHSRQGAKIAETIALRFKLNDEDRNIFTFLVGNHLLMAILAQRRNLDDPVLINQFAGKVENVRKLKLLYLLTFSDLRSVSHDGMALTPWKNKLFKELFDKSMDLFSLGKYKKWVFGEEIEKYRESMAIKFRNAGRKRRFKKFLDTLPESYFRSFDEKRIKKHFKMFERLSKKSFSMDISTIKDYGVNRLAVCTKDTPGLFSAIAGALSASKINILTSLIFSSTEKHVIDVFSIQGSEGKELADDDIRWNDFKKLFNLWVNRGEEFQKEINLRLAKRKSILDEDLPKVEHEIRFDNLSSPNFSILEVYAEDRIGLLYELSRALNDMAINIHFAKISTEGNRAQDIFYLTDLKGKKFASNAELLNIKKNLKKAVFS